MAPAVELTTLADTIQLALAPAFLLVATFSFLNVATGRLARVVDRARRIADDFPAEPGPEHDRAVWELRRLDRRMSMINTSILLGVASTVLVCLVVGSLFIANLTRFEFANAVAVAFALAMALLIAGLILFLIEVQMAHKTIHVRDEFLERGP